MLSRSHVAVEGVNHLLGNRVYQHCWEFNDLLHSESLFLRVIVLALTLKIEHNRVVNLSFEQKVINLTRICSNNTVLKVKQILVVFELEEVHTKGSYFMPSTKNSSLLLPCFKT